MLERVVMKRIPQHRVKTIQTKESQPRMDSYFNPWLTLYFI
ncbi:hypothetical protein CGSSa03_08425 [Staphylococcus aureus subsp. aureus CGS03]|nr:hypothetical protein CGSSa03_08425 [Staphylococcus aureus subsp. aureus CGS03]